MSVRKIIEIDEDLCNGCGNCIPNCPEGALQVIDGKARLISDLFCDGLGACIGECPIDAISVIEREAEPYNETIVMANIVKAGTNTIIAHLKHLKDHGETKLYEEAVDYLKNNNIDNPLEKVKEERIITGEQNKMETEQEFDNNEMEMNEENETDYAQVEFTQSAHPGGITIWVSDALAPDNTNIPDLPTWIKTQTRYELSSTIDSTLGGKPAIKFLSKKGDRIMGIAAVNDSLVWIVEATVYDEVYWQKVFNQMTQSFKFIPPEFAGSEAAPTENPPIDTSNDYYAAEEEEVIE